MLTSLVESWADEIIHGKVISVDPDDFYRVSCKLDASMLIYMARPNNRIREMCIQIISDFYDIQQTFSKHGDSKGDLPLAAILFYNERSIKKKALFSFLEKHSKGSILTTTNATSIDIPSFFEVARSQYSVLFIHYLGELATLFAEYGRPKATRHCAKYLKIHAIPFIGQQITDKSPEFILPYSGCMILLMALSGTPISSDTEASINSYRQAHLLLLACFKNGLPQVLVKEETIEVVELLDSMYFLNRKVVNIFTTELLER